MKEESNPNELTLITPEMIMVLEKRRYNSSMAKCQNQTDWLYGLANNPKRSEDFKKLVNYMFSDVERIIEERSHERRI